MAAAVAMATPVVLLTATSASALGASTAQTQNQPTYAELKQDAADAKKAHEDAVTAKEEGLKELKATLAALDSDEHPLKAAVLAAERAAKEAAATKTAAEKAVADAEAKLEAAADDTEKAAAQQALDAAQADLAKAVTAAKNADAEVEKADAALDDARVAASRKYGQLQTAAAKTLKDLETADAALAAAGQCVREAGLTALADGLPSKVTAGTTVDFTLRVTNGTERTLTVDPLVAFHTKDADKHPLKVEWSDGSAWQTLDDDSGAEYIGHIETMKPGDHHDVKMRMTVDSAARATDAFALLAGDASDAYNPCVLGPMKRYDFKLLPAGSKPGPVDDAEPGRPQGNDDHRASGTHPGPSPQGGTPTPTTTTSGARTNTSGNLAETGASSTTMPLALTSAATLTLGAAALLIARRRKTTGNN
ncbi:hypothetical protein [Streptomyces sp. NPDC047024]|uniref:hypothetical protein n=1 Tax=Streptomyces sp. NPDC047024 TaxID=3155476 RepID=UPI0033EEBAD7